MWVWYNVVMVKTVEVETKTFVRFWLVIVALGVLGLFLWRARTGIVLVGVSIFLAVAIRPLALKLERMLGGRKRRGAASVLAVVIVVSVVGLIVALVGPVVINETASFVEQAPDAIQSSLSSMGGLDVIGEKFGISGLSEQITGEVKKFSTDIISNISSVVMTGINVISNILTGTVLVIVLTALFLAQGPDILRKLWMRIARRNDKTGAMIQRITVKISNVISKYVISQVMVAVLDGLVVGVVTFVLSLIFGFPSGLAFPMALISGVLYLVPMFGAIIACVLISVLLFFQAPMAGVIFLVIYIVYQQVENNIISPKIQGDSLELPSLVILIAITLGMYMFGLVGAIISIPIAGILKVLIDEAPNLWALKKQQA